MKAPERRTCFLVTCEHGGKRIPSPYQALFAGHEALLHSHRGYDRGALVLARELARALDCSVFAATVSRLLIDLNRSPGHPALYSEITRPLPQTVRTQLFARYYLPYRHRVDRHIAGAVAQGDRVVHISSHSFTPTLGDQARNADVGFLYDPARSGEQALCLRWMTALRHRSPGIIVRRNYPYAGRADGFCTALRRRHHADDYLGIELEINQRHVAAGGPAWRLLRADIVAALLHALAGDAHDESLPIVISNPAGPSSSA